VLNTGQYKDMPNTTNFDQNDPYLPQKLVGYYQQHMGKVTKLAETPFYQQGQPQPDDDETPPNVPPAAPQKAAPIDPDALLKRYMTAPK
jgi:hypothetical protein